MAIFQQQKNITSKMDENALKYMSRTNLHFDIGLGKYVPEKFFTKEKLKFLVPSYWKKLTREPDNGLEGS